MTYKTHQWYKGGYDNRFYYYFWAKLNGQLLGAEYDIDGELQVIDAWDDELFSRPRDAIFIKVEKNWDPWNDKKEKTMHELIRILWEYCQ